MCSPGLGQDEIRESILRLEPNEIDARHIVARELRCTHNISTMRFCLNDPLVKWLSDALPIIMSNDRCFVDRHNEETIDANGIRFRTITDVKKVIWSECTTS
jgi:hypothetical protein